MLRRGFAQPVHPLLFHTGAGGTNQRLSRRTTCTKARMHIPWRPLRCAILPCWIAVRPICSALRSEIFHLHPRRVFKTNLSSLHRLYCARYSNLFNLYTTDGLKIGLVRVRVCARASERRVSAHMQKQFGSALFGSASGNIFISPALFSFLPLILPLSVSIQVPPISLQTFGNYLIFLFGNPKTE